VSGNIEDGYNDGGRKPAKTARDRENEYRAGRGKSPISEQDWPRWCDMKDQYKNGVTKEDRQFANSELAKMDSDPGDRFGPRPRPVPMPAHLRAAMAKMVGKATPGRPLPPPPPSVEP
jgi:hypothetical protein